MGPATRRIGEKVKKSKSVHKKSERLLTTNNEEGKSGKNAVDQRNPTNSRGSHLLPGADLEFGKSQRKISRKQDLSCLESSQFKVPSKLELTGHISNLSFTDPLYTARNNHLLQIASEFKDWVWELLGGFNILVFGIGCKRKLIDKFSSEFLCGQFVFEIDGNSSTSSINIIVDLLRTISIEVLDDDGVCLEDNLVLTAKLISDNINRKFLRHEDTTISNDLLVNLSDDNNPRDSTTRHSSSSHSTDNTFKSAMTNLASGKGRGGRYSEAKSKIYILIHSIEAFSSPHAQACLAELASCPSIGIVAIMESFNTPLMWNQDMLCKFRWIYKHAPTFEPFDNADCNWLAVENSILTRKVGGSARKGGGGGLVQTNKRDITDVILQSLTLKHKELLAILAADSLSKRQQTNPIDSNSTSTSTTITTVVTKTKKAQKTGAGANTINSTSGMTKKVLLKLCVERMVARKEMDLMKLLSELRDHNLIRIDLDSDNTEWIYILGSVELLKSFSQIQKRP